MSEKEGKKRHGRLMKKNDPVLDVVNITEFKLTDIGESPTVYPDNFNANIIHRNLHMEIDIDAALKEPELAHKDLSSESNRRPVMRPVDFTADWNRMRQRASKRGMRFDDEDELEAELEYLTSRDTGDESPDSAEAAGTETGEPGGESRTAGRAPEETGTGAGEAPTAPPGQNPIESPLPGNDDTNSPLVINRDTVDANRETVDAAGDAIRNMAPPAPATEESLEREDQLSSGIIPETSPGPPPGEVPPTTPAPQAPAEQVREVATPPPEAAGAADDAFRNGEEEGRQEGRRQILELSNRMLDTLSELEGLKKNILMNAQQNFQVLCQAMLESVLQKEFDLNPEAFARFLERAISETVPKDDFKLRVNPEALEAIRSVISPDLAERLVADPEVKNGEFRIESNMSVVDGKIGDMIRTMLDGADLNLFPTKDKTG